MNGPADVLNCYVAIRFDVSASIGTGHLRRAVTFGKELTNRGIPYCYVTQNQEVETAIMLGIPANKLIGFDPYIGESDWIHKIPNLTHVVADFCHHERINPSAGAIIEGIKATRNLAIAVIDSIPPHHFECTSNKCPTLLITPYFDAENLRSSPNCDSWLAGAKYAILDQEYLNLHRIIEQKPLSPGQYVLICCGGSDPDRVTEFILQLLTDAQPPQTEIKLVIGNLFTANRIKIIEQIAIRYPEKVSLYTGRSNIADLIADCGVLLGLVGLIRYEAACLGKPSYLVQNNSDYENYLRNFDRGGLGKVFCLQNKNERINFEKFTRNLKSRDFFSRVSEPNKVAFELVDGCGVQRILDIFLTSNKRSTL